jgi:hypothetical protein
MFLDQGVISGDIGVLFAFAKRGFTGYRPRSFTDNKAFIIAHTGDAMRAVMSTAMGMALDTYTGGKEDFISGNSSGAAVALNRAGNTSAENIHMFYAPDGVPRLNSREFLNRRWYNFTENGVMNNTHLTGAVMGPGGSFPANFQAIKDSGKQIIVGTTNRDTLGVTHHVLNPDQPLQALETVRVSTWLPWASKGPVPTLNGRREFDGAFSDPLSMDGGIEAALAKGIKDINVIMISSQHPTVMDDLGGFEKGIVGHAGGYDIGNRGYASKLNQRYEKLAAMGKPDSPLLTGRYNYVSKSGEVVPVKVVVISPPATEPKMDPIGNDRETMKAAAIRGYAHVSAGLGEVFNVQPELRPHYNPDKGVQPEVPANFQGAVRAKVNAPAITP